MNGEKKTTTGGLVVSQKKWNVTNILVEDKTGYLKYMNCVKKYTVEIKQKECFPKRSLSKTKIKKEYHMILYVCFLEMCGFNTKSLFE